MKHKMTTAALALALAIEFAWAQEPAPESPAAAAQVALEAAEARRAQAEAAAAAAYEKGLRAAEVEQREALKAVEAARRELERAAQERARAAESQRAAAERTAREREEALRSREEVQRELQRAHENLRRASREVARVHRELNRQAPGLELRREFVFQSADDAAIGVIIGGQDADGVEVLGVSPDGPAERAGVQPGDRIVAIMGQPLTDSDSGATHVLLEALAEIEAGDEITLTLERDGQRRQVDVVAERREPFTWQSFAPLATVPAGETREIIIERMEMPDIDPETLEREMGRLHEELERSRVLIQRHGAPQVPGAENDWVFEFEEFSDLGDALVAGTGMWFGMPLTRGLRMAELEPDLGEYFGAERGVLVLRARDDNLLQLRSGDVILSVQGREVSSPTDVMRALRSLEAGTEAELTIRRQQREETVRVTVPETRIGWNFAPVVPGSALPFDFVPQPAPDAPAD